MADFDPVHPGEILKADFLLPLEMSQYALAKHLNTSQMRVSEIVNGKRSISPDTALRLAQFFQTSPEFWLGLQTTYDLECAKDSGLEEIQATVKPRAA